MMRLGSGIKGSSNDIQALKRHPFFNGIDFENLHITIPPIKQIRDLSPYETLATEKSENRSNGSTSRTKSYKVNDNKFGLK